MLKVLIIVQGIAANPMNSIIGYVGKVFLTEALKTTKGHFWPMIYPPTDVPPIIRTILSWNFPVMIPDREMESSDEGIEVF